ncbi:bacillithiol system protein YtxJ [Robiginitalea myxolifaciens]|uniref:Bacillithiol system protein YtxJ n=1 Tax=Robiginitalea myxolifaciens TaxID=400055 RepID=A0A1I6GSP4_9FLAO|nr:bacillithiol system redox-active protein YtxJ [Robiginitalea myxolifaciens]SFR45293.1 bacillithiol system protein YtxJ [Robiginitalea myxolifaciens]
MKLGSLFKSGRGDKPVFPWKPLNQEEQLEQLLQDSADRPQVVFKHSTRCGISSMMLRRFENIWINEEGADFYYLDLISFRGLSAMIADKSGVRHESPQVLIFENGQVKAVASHSAIGELSL